MRTQVAALAGHRDMKMTLRYAHLEPSHLLAGIQALEQRSPRPGLGPITVQDLTRPTWQFFLPIQNMGSSKSIRTALYCAH